MHADDIDMVAVKLAQDFGATTASVAAGRRPAMGEIDDAVHHRKQRVHVVCGEQDRGAGTRRERRRSSATISATLRMSRLASGSSSSSRRGRRIRACAISTRCCSPAGQAADPLIGERRRLHRFEHLVDLPPAPPRRQRKPSRLPSRPSATRSRARIGM